jgi:hypothetical protein
LLNFTTYPSEDSSTERTVYRGLFEFLPHTIFLHLFIGGNECGAVSTAVLIVRFMTVRDEECPSHAYWPLFE